MDLAAQLTWRLGLRMHDDVRCTRFDRIGEFVEVTEWQQLLRWLDSCEGKSNDVSGPQHPMYHALSWALAGRRGCGRRRCVPEIRAEERDDVSVRRATSEVDM